MPARLRQRQSRLAAWSWWLALASVPVVLGVGLAHRTGRIGTPMLYYGLAVGFCLAFAGLVAALAAFEGIWRDGRGGLGRAIRGFLLAVLVLVLPAYSAWQIVTLPRLAEVTTDPVRPPAFVFDQGARATGSADAALQKEAYPDVVPRRYPVDVVKVFAEARRLVGARGWDVLDATQPANVRSTGRIEAVARTVVFGLREDVAIRFEPDGSGTRVDMRSASRYGAHDMGSNAERVRAFLNDLDFAIAGLPPTS
jgi:hypothetical protein